MSEIPVPIPESERNANPSSEILDPTLSPEIMTKVGWFTQRTDSLDLPDDQRLTCMALDSHAYNALATAEIEAYNSRMPFTAEKKNEIYKNIAAQYVPQNPDMARRLSNYNLYLKHALAEYESRENPIDQRPSPDPTPTTTITPLESSTLGSNSDTHKQPEVHPTITPATESLGTNQESDTDSTLPPSDESLMTSDESAGPEEQYMAPESNEEAEQRDSQPLILTAGTVLLDNQGKEYTIQSIDEDKKEVLFQNESGQGGNISLDYLKEQITSNNPTFTIKSAPTSEPDEAEGLSREEKEDKVLNAVLKTPEERTSNEQELIESHFNSLAEDESLELPNELHEKIKNYKDLSSLEQLQLIKEVATQQEKTPQGEKQHVPLHDEVKVINKNIGQALIKGDISLLKENVGKIKELLKSHPEILKFKKGVKTGIKGLGMTALILFGLFITAEAALLKAMGGSKG